MGLSNYQLVLLDNLIYLDTITKYGKGEGNDTIGAVVAELLYADGNPDNGKAGTGTIKTDCYNAHNGGANSMMTLDEWVTVLKAIAADTCLCDLQIHNVEDAGKNGFRAATFISNETSENVIIFRGTSTANEWTCIRYGIQFLGTARCTKETIHRRARSRYLSHVAVHNIPKYGM